MKNTIIKTLFAALALSSLAGCIEEAEYFGQTITKEEASANAATFLPSSINGITASMTTADLVGTDYQSDFGLPAIHIMTESMLEDCIAKAEPGYDQFYYFVYCSYMDPADPEGTYYWPAYYKWIKMANDVIGMINPETTDPVELYALAQAYSYRALCYLDLARLYEPKQNIYVPVKDELLGLTVPIITEKTTQAEVQNNPRAPREKMYEFILSDLTAAGEIFAEVPGSGLFSEASLGAVYGMMARAYLEMGYWGDEHSAEYFASAAAYAKAVQAAYEPLSYEQWHDPATGFNSGSSNYSWMWGLTLAASNTNNLLNFTAMVSTEAQWGYGPYVFKGVSEEFYNQIAEGDMRKDSYISPYWNELAPYWEMVGQPELAAACTETHNYKFAGTADDKMTILYMMATLGATYPSLKFRPANGITTNSTTGTLADHPLMRVEEMYFIEMEAVAQTEGPAAAKALLESFMNTYRIMGETPYTCEAADLDSFLTEMLFQKRVEFWGEGILFFDYKRLDAPTNRTLYSQGQLAPWLCQYLDGRSPQWNVCIPETETQNNKGIPKELNNPDPSNFRE